MNENPYTGLINIMRSEGSKFNPPSVCLGQVVSPDPLVVRTGELTLEADDLFVNESLMNDYARSVSVELKGTLQGSTDSTSGGSGESSFASHNHNITGSCTLTGSGDIIHKTSLNKNDIVVMIPAPNNQQYIIFCKVVKLL